jgi:signal transduction histidine kinase
MNRTPSREAPAPDQSGGPHRLFSSQADDPLFVRRWPQRLWLAAIVALIVCIFIVDVVTPQDLFTQFLYAPVLLATLWLRRPRITVAVAVASMILAALDAVLSPVAQTPLWIALTNRVFTIAALWMVTWLVLAVHTALATVEDRVQARTADLQRLSGELALAEQRERQRLGLVLHDGLQQLLVACRLRVDLLARASDPTAIQTGCASLAGLLEQAVQATRSLTAELIPAILNEGLIPALQWLAGWMQDTHHLTVDLAIHDRPPDLNEPTRLLLFQSVRELLFNAVKHAKGTAARVEVKMMSNAVQVAVSDNGVGFDPATIQPVGAGGLGLRSIRQRLEYLGGTLEIASTPGQGSRFTLSLPVRPTAPP